MLIIIGLPLVAKIALWVIIAIAVMAIVAGIIWAVLCLLKGRSPL